MVYNQQFDTQNFRINDYITKNHTEVCNAHYISQFFIAINITVSIVM